MKHTGCDIDGDATTAKELVVAFFVFGSQPVIQEAGSQKVSCPVARAATKRTRRIELRNQRNLGCHLYVDEQRDPVIADAVQKSQNMHSFNNSEPEQKDSAETPASPNRQITHALLVPGGGLEPPQPFLVCGF